MKIHMFWLLWLFVQILRSGTSYKIGGKKLPCIRDSLITKMRIHTSGTNKAGLGPVAFLIAVKISIFVRPARG
jgi:hypothetical protein